MSSASGPLASTRLHNELLVSEMRRRYPDMVPVIVRKRATVESLPQPLRSKFLVHRDQPATVFLAKLRKEFMPSELQASSSTALCFYVSDVNDTTGRYVPFGNVTMGQLYDQYANASDGDGMLHLRYDRENVFGRAFIVHLVVDPLSPT